MDTRWKNRPRPTIEDMRQSAVERGGECISTEYLGWNVKLRWRCKRGHEWDAMPNNVRRGTWCPECEMHDRWEKFPKHTLVDLVQFATSMSGKCLSAEYGGTRSCHQWECKKGHKWSATWDNVRRGTWCPRCKERRHERECREIFERLTNHEFPLTRNAIGRRLELDGYCRALQIAFEYNGEQHYRPHPVWHRNESDFEAQKRRDQEKIDLCRQAGIRLLVIPYTMAKRLEEYISEFLLKSS